MCRSACYHWSKIDRRRYSWSVGPACLTCRSRRGASHAQRPTITLESQRSVGARRGVFHLTACNRAKYNGDTHRQAFEGRPNSRHQCRPVGQRFAYMNKRPKLGSDKPTPNVRLCPPVIARCAITASTSVESTHGSTQGYDGRGYNNLSRRVAFSPAAIGAAGIARGGVGEDPIPRPHSTRYSPHLARGLFVSQKVQSSDLRKPAQVLGRVAIFGGHTPVQFGALSRPCNGGNANFQNGTEFAHPPQDARDGASRHAHPRSLDVEPVGFGASGAW
ncbi:hypothetical protein C8J44_2238 [Sphingomonas sp. PP-CE-3A-406]|nr:hypothetical protein C8J44_2238 [Sphingomonas sp. PP-CE-3A-406]